MAEQETVTLTIEQAEALREALETYMRYRGIGKVTPNDERGV